MNLLVSLPPIILSALVLVGFIANVIGATVYDIKSIKKTKFVSKHKNSRKLRVRPLISIVVGMHNHQNQIEDFLQSIKDVSYRKYQLILIDNHSSDETLKLARNFAKNHQKKDIRIIAKKSYGDWTDAFEYAIKKYARGQLIFILNPAQTLEKNSLKNSVNYFNMNPKLKTLSVNKSVKKTDSIISILTTFLALLNSQTKKRNNFFMSSRHANHTSIIFSKDIDIKKAKKINHYYASDVIVYDCAIKNIHKLTLLTQPMMLTYFVLLAVVLDQKPLFFVGWLATVIILGFALWTDDRHNFFTKMKLSLYLPIMYLLVIIMTIMNVLVFIFGLVHYARLNRPFAKAKSCSLNTNKQAIPIVEKNIQISRLL